MQVEANANIVDSSLETFARDVMEASREQLVMVDFWADWCGPCKSLTPVLERLVAQYGGKLKLVKIDTEKHQDIAAQFQIRSLPTVFFFFRGEPVDQFMGVLPEPAIREKIDKYLVSQSERALQQAIAAYEAGQQEQAMAFLQQVIQNEPGNEAARLQLLQWLSLANRMEEAGQLADTLSENAKAAPQYRAYLARREFMESMESMGPTGDVDELRAKVEADDADLESRFQLALALVAADRAEEAMQHLLVIIERDRAFRDGEPRETMIKVFHILGGKGELVSRYRGRLARILN